MEKLSVSIGIVVLALFLSGQAAADSSEDLVRSKRDTSEWVRRVDAPFLQDFGNSTQNNATSNVWKKCSCDFSGCDCYAEYRDFNNSKLYFRIEHIKTHSRFRVTFRNENKTISQHFTLYNGTSCFQFWKQNFDQVCFLRYGWENNSIVDKACFALGVRIQKYSSISLDYECIKHMSDGTTHVGPLNITQPDLNFLANFTLYGAASSNNQSVFALLLSVVSALLIARYES